MNDKKWIIGEYNDEVVDNLSSALSVSPICARLLIRRGYCSTDAAKVFLNKDICGFHSPFLMKDLEKSVKIIEKARSSRQKTVIWGDYDVDGVTSVTILYKYLKSIGVDVEYYIPRRLDEGYGLNTTAIDDFYNKGFSLLITVDCGITADSEIDYAKKLGFNVIVTDHHECRSTLPPADAIINPKRPDCIYPFKELAGVGVAFKLICGCKMMIEQLTHAQALQSALKLYSDLTSIGTIADVMPVKDENRLIVDRGLYEISNTSNPGLQALIDDAGIYSKSYKKKKISSTTIGFVLAPKINAAGRMGTSRSAVDLFLTNSREYAAQLTSELSQINRERQILENEILNQAIEKIENEFDFENEKIIILSDDTWHHGVIGIVASRITEKYNLPTILISFKNEGHEMSDNLGKGSGRSIKGFNIIDALGNCTSLLVKYGGHELAAGLTVDRKCFKQFKNRMNELVKKAFTQNDAESTIEVDCRVSADEISIDTVNEISKLEPFGLCNAVPIFYSENMTVESLISIGENKHTKLILKKDGKTFVALFFGKPMASLGIVEGDVIDVLFNMDVNNFKNQQTVQMILRDIRLNSELDKRIKSSYARYNQISINTSLPVRHYEVPTRDDFRAIYTLLKNAATSTSSKEFEINIPACTRLIKKRYGVDVSVCKVLIIFDVFEEAGLVDSRLSHTDMYVRYINTDSILNSPDKKIELTLTSIMQNLISRIN